MSEFGSEDDDYVYASPSPSTRRNGPFSATMLSDEADFERSSDQEDGAASQFTQSDDQSGEPIPTTSTPDLSFAASSSPFLFSTGESSSLHARSCDRCGSVASLSELTSDHTSFVCRLHYLLQQAVDQQRYYRTGDNIRIQPDSHEEVSGLDSQVVSIAHDEVLESALGQREYDDCFSPLPSQKVLKSSSLLGNTSDDSLNILAIVASDAGVDSRRNKRKAKPMDHEDSEAPAASVFHDGNPSDDYLSASDGGPSVPSRSRYPPSKKRKCLSLDTQLSIVSPCASSLALSDTNSVLSKSSSVQRWKDIESNTVCNVPEGPAEVTPSHSCVSSAAGSALSYPPTQLATPVPGVSPVLSPVPVLGPQEFSQADLPCVFSNSDDAAEARLLSLLRKETLYWRGESQGALSAWDFAAPNTLLDEVIAWILTVEPPLGSPTASELRGRAHSYDLHEQLTVHHDSRFLAALIFSSFFVPARRDSEALVELDQSDARHFQELEKDEDVVIWDYAVAAIALAVKIHRDNFPPLKPIFGNHFLALASHEMNFEDLEWAQRDLLRYFSYNLGMPTPQAFLDELRLALPTLRHTLESEHEWEDVLSETWKQLMAAARWPSMLCFPVSLLTATALIESIKRVNNRRLSSSKLNAPAKSPKSTSDCPMRHAAPGALQSIVEHGSSEDESEILRITSAAFKDIREVLEISTEKIDECERWFELARSAPEKPVLSKYFQWIS